MICKCYPHRIVAYVIVVLCVVGSAEELVASGVYSWGCGTYCNMSSHTGHCNPFAILEVGNSRVRTHTLYKTHNPSWDKTFNL